MKESTITVDAKSNHGAEGYDIAIIGMACRFPGATNPQEFWLNLQSGQESSTLLSDDELKKAGVPTEVIEDSNYVKRGIFLEDVEMFDAGFFGFSPMDAKIMDPQHRHFLECSWAAFEDAGCDPEKFDGAIGVYAGSGHNAYMPYNLLTNPDLINEVGFFLIRHTGNDKDFLATRASYCFNLKGPSVNVQTACSTSLVAVHMGVQSLLNNECDMVLTGGVTIELPLRQGYMYKENEILSPDGRCRPFEASSGGTVFGSGVGVVILRRLDDALDANDNIHAVIKSTAINNDGARKVSYLAPSVEGQAAAILEALEVGEIDPQRVSYIECHGTGTQMGDPIEIAALTQAYGMGSDLKQYCGIGSVKSNIGHTDNAAGVASLIKVIQSLKHKQLAPTLHYEHPNKDIDFLNSPFYVVSKLQDWNSEEPRLAAVSSLGVGGTNAHVIVQEAPVRPSSSSSREWHLIQLSARTTSSLQKSTIQLAEFFEDNPDVALADVAHTLQIGRRGFPKRCFTVVHSVIEAIDVLGRSDKERLITSDSPTQPKSIAFMFAGGGAQYPNMGLGLYQSEDVFRETVDECLALLDSFVDYDLKALLYPDMDSVEAATSELQKPSRTLPALFIAQFAQAKLWMSWGVQPEAIVGHSVGENTAACLAGVISLKDAIGLVALRGRLFEKVPEGGMLSVQLSEVDLKPYLSAEAIGTEIDIAAVNAPELSVASGPKAALGRLEQLLIKKEIPCQRIHINIAAHSRMVNPILGEFGDYLAGIELNKPQIPFLSNRSGVWIRDEEATDPQYWINHLRQTVRFADCANTLLTGGKYVMLEVGPGRTLSSLVDVQNERTPEHRVHWSMRHPEQEDEDIPFMLAALGRIWQGNGVVDWNAYYRHEQCKRISLPTYCFSKVRHWVEPGKSTISGSTTSTVGLEKKESLAEWMYHPVWHRSPLPTHCPDSPRVLLVEGQHSINQQLIEKLEETGALLTRVTPGARYEKLRDNCYSVQPNNPDDFVYVLSDLAQQKQVPEYILYTLALDVDESTESGHQAKVFDNLLYLSQALGNEDVTHEIRWVVLTSDLQQVSSELIKNPIQSLVLGPCRVIPHEFPTIQCSTVDICARDLSPWLIDQLVLELYTANNATTVAYRGVARFCQAYEHQLFIDSQATSVSTVKKGNTYLITGGLGDLGLVAAKELAKLARVNLVLVSRSEFPDREYWQELANQGAPESDTIQRIQQVEILGADVVILQGDITNIDELEGVKATIERKFGAVNGIIHAAGVIDDALIQTKETTEASAVLAPKVTGTLLLAEVFSVAELEFFLLFGSTSALHGLTGQVDYTAANAFLDSYAHYQSGMGVSNTISINWQAWKDVGMAASMVQGRRKIRQPAGRPVDHPLLDRCIKDTEEETAYSTLFNVHDYWLLNEHRIKGGSCLIPGSGFIELARAAYKEARGVDCVNIENVALSLPFSVEDGDTRELRVLLKHRDDQADFVISSKIGGDWLDNATGIVGKGKLLSETQNLQVLQNRCDESEQYFTHPDHHPLLEFGERWTCLQKVCIGQREAIINLQMPTQYHSDLDHFCLHPAVLDMATAGAQVLIGGNEKQKQFFVPVGYGRIQFDGSMPTAAFSHVVYKSRTEDDQDGKTAEFDVSVYDGEGKLFLRIDDFLMQQVNGVDAINQATAWEKNETDPALIRTLELGIEEDEGAEIIRYLLGTRAGPQVIISTYNLTDVTAELVKPLTTAVTPESERHDPDADPDIPLVETILNSHPAIEEVVVRSNLNEDGSKRLIAHYLPNDFEPVTVSELRRFAKEKLATGQVPQYFLEVDEMPQLEDGSIDRKMLVDPYAPEDNYIAPRTTTEKVLAKVWREVLGVDRVGITDNFFDAGGHSLLSIRVIVRIDKKLGVRLDQAKMVLSTLEQLAWEIDENKGLSLDGVSGNPQSANSPKNGQAEVQAPRSALLESLFGRKS